MVLLSDSTISELCSSTTPTSQFSSLHFIAAAAIGAKSMKAAALAGSRAQDARAASEVCGVLARGARERCEGDGPHAREWAPRGAVNACGRPAGDDLTAGGGRPGAHHATGVGGARRRPGSAQTRLEGRGPAAALAHDPYPVSTYATPYAIRTIQLSNFVIEPCRRGSASVRLS
ncbi:hypothetical protein EVAR_29260_1 [Eumeta japonica]|uniref:Uncharacterized protein n=1 Tax=Eumeta variegata TaxID=151549 RepID=A0A4C1VH95_EUMVA|nr:hypothetical protein EVAR_29260_1 [Eumeta japonica]